MTMDSVNPAAKTIPEALFMLYQMTFAIITVALVAGSVADRMRFSAYLLVLRSAGSCSSMCRWRTGYGAAASSATMGVLDFAGGLVVHLSAGIGGLVAAKVMGRRHGYGSENLVAVRSVARRDRHRIVVGRLVRLQRRIGAGSEFARGDGDHRNPSRRLRRRADLGRDRMGDAAQAVGARHDLGRGRGPGTITPASGFVAPWHGIIIGVVAGLVVLLGLHLAQASFQL